MAVIRAPHAAARILDIRHIRGRRASGRAGRADRGEDLIADGIGRLHTMVQRHKRDGTPMERPPFYPLAIERVRFIGEGVAIVVAETRNAARDAADMVEVEYEPLEAVGSALAATEPDAPAFLAGAGRLITFPLFSKPATLRE